MRDVWTYLRQNPQVLVLLLICVVLGFGTFLAVVFGLIAASPGRSTGEPSGSTAAGRVSLADAGTSAASRQALSAAAAAIPAQRRDRARRAAASRGPGRCSGREGVARSRLDERDPSAAAGGVDAEARSWMTRASPMEARLDAARAKGPRAGRRVGARQSRARRATAQRRTGTYVRKGRGGLGRNRKGEGRSESSRQYDTAHAAAPIEDHGSILARTRSAGITCGTSVAPDFSPAQAASIERQLLAAVSQRSDHDRRVLVEVDAELFGSASAPTAHRRRRASSPWASPGARP